MNFISESKEERRLALFLVLGAIALRFLPHPSNFTPVASVALFSGAVLPPSLALFLPLVIMVASDLVAGPHDLFAFTWGSFVGVALIGMLLRRRSGPLAVLVGSLGGSTLFFLVTNLGVFFYGGLYPRTVTGLRDCYFMALPFFRNAVAGDLFYAAVLFGVYSLVRSRFRKPASQGASS